MTLSCIQILPFVRLIGSAARHVKVERSITRGFTNPTTYLGRKMEKEYGRLKYEMIFKVILLLGKSLNGNM